ncbi:MAG: formate dehydrogenase accessory sulfurtransferase FdhD [Acidobacteria bacterium]|nr:formate dehydrogenase accessory sulfurtransferase FdhD [Acidobacteriota bacterium]MBV9478920.1 formate dehydrogenase accessory sulfurtransferase FdhD [Acidobacteriota bacterium]
MAEERMVAVPVTRIAETRDASEDVVVIEEPLEISAAWTLDGELREKTISVTMRTRGDDYDLAAGFLFTEGLIASGDAIESIRHWGSPNRVRVALTPSTRIDTSKLERHFYTTSSCGVCGKTSIDAIRVAHAPLPDRPPAPTSIIRVLPRILREAQLAFPATGGVHGAGLVDHRGELLRVREDIGRHNAVDKLIGAYIREQHLPPPNTILISSSRASFELVQKAVVAQISTIAFVGAPSSLAIDLAQQMNVTLLAFVRDGRFNVYSGRVS